MALLEVKDIKKSFGKSSILKGISFELERGEVLAIIGSSGSGKTTLLRCLNYLEVPDSGKIIVNEETVFDSDAGDFTDKSIRNLRLHFGLVFQSFNLFPQYTVFENITLAPKLKIKDSQNRAEELARVNERAMELLQTVGLSDKKDFYPCQLSGGQQQRVAIARALALFPDVLCFDEPTSALDPELTGEVLRVIRDLANDNRTMIVVTHEMEFAKSVANKIIFMADGVIEEMGTPDEVFNHPKSPKTRAFLNKSLESF